MKNSIPRYTFYKHKYGSELLVDVVELKYVKKFLAKSAVHTLNYYDITFITEGKGAFSVDNQTYEAIPRDVLFSKPGEIRNWECPQADSKGKVPLFIGGNSGYSVQGAIEAH